MSTFTIISIVVIIVIIICVAVYYTKTYNEIANVYPTKNCDYKDYYYIWVNMKLGDDVLSNPAHKDWCTELLLSGPNCIGIYVSQRVGNDVLEEYVRIYKEVFKFDPTHIRGNLSANNEKWCSRNQLKIKKSTYKLKFC